MTRAERHRERVHLLGGSVLGALVGSRHVHLQSAQPLFAASDKPFATRTGTQGTLLPLLMRVGEVSSDTARPARLLRCRVRADTSRSALLSRQARARLTLQSARTPTNKQTARASIARPSPTGPIFSSVFAFTLTATVASPSAAAMRSRMAGMCGAIFGAWATMQQAVVVHYGDAAQHQRPADHQLVRVPTFADAQCAQALQQFEAHRGGVLGRGGHRVVIE